MHRFHFGVEDTPYTRGVLQFEVVAGFEIALA
jgi:hypothetical protein